MLKYCHSEWFHWVSVSRIQNSWHDCKYCPSFARTLCEINCISCISSGLQVGSKTFISDLANCPVYSFFNFFFPGLVCWMRLSFIKWIVSRYYFIKLMYVVAFEYTTKWMLSWTFLNSHICQNMSILFIFIYYSIFRNTSVSVWGCESRLNLGTNAFIVLNALTKGPLVSVLIKGWRTLILYFCCAFVIDNIN